MKKFLSLLLLMMLLAPMALAEDAVIPATTMMFRPAPPTLQAEAHNVYPYIGMTLDVPEALREMLASGEVFSVYDADVDWAEDGGGTLQHAWITFYHVPQDQRSRVPYIGEDPIVMQEEFEPWIETLPLLGRIDIWQEGSADLDAFAQAHADDDYRVFGEDSGLVYTATLVKETPDGAQDALDNVAAALEGAALYALRPIDDKFMGPTTPEEKLVGNIGTFSAEDIQGNAADQSIFADARLTLVNVWTTWCSPCIEEIPHLGELHRELADQGVQIVGILADGRAFDTGELDPDALEKAGVIMERTGADYPVIVPDDALEGGLLDGLLGYPTSYLVDSEGNVLGESILGSRSKAEWEKILLDGLAQVESGIQ